MSRSFILGLIITASFAAFAGPSLIRYQPLNGDCTALDHDADRFITAVGDERELTTGKVTSAIDFLKSIRAPSDEEVQAILPALKANLETNLDKYLTLSAAACLGVRAKLSVSMINSAAKTRVSIQNKVEIIVALKDELKKNRYPNFLAATILSTLLKNGTEKALWTLTPEDSKTLNQLQKSLKSEVEELTPKFDQAAAAIGKNVPRPDTLKENRKFQSLKSIYAREVADSEKFLAQLQKIVADIK